MANKTRATIAKNVLLSLEAQGFSQYEIGRRTGISRGQVFNILRGRTGIGPKSIKAIVESRKTDQKMLLLRDYGRVWIDPANRRQRSLVGQYWNAIKTARESGDWSGLKKFKNRKVTIIDKGKRVRLSLVTDPEEIKKLEDRHQLEPIEIGYRRLKRSKARK